MCVRARLLTRAHVRAEHGSEYAEARRLLGVCVAGYTAQLGADHVQTLAAQNNLATLLQQLGERGGAAAPALADERAPARGGMGAQARTG